MKSFLARRPHRSFRLTRRRDYVRSLNMPGYWAFTFEVFGLLRKNAKTFMLMAVVYAIITVTFVGIGSQETYAQLSDVLTGTSREVFSGNWGEIGKASVLFLATVQGGIVSASNEVQQIYAGLIVILTWLTTVWILRNHLGGGSTKLRDGLYNSGAPLLSTVLVAFTLLFQMLPLAVALIGYSAAAASGLLTAGIAGMVFWTAFSLLVLLSLYWMAGTFMALVVVTLPGMYPMRALRIGGDMVVGRRLKILLRMLWSLVGLALSWIVVLIPMILFDKWIKSLWSAIDWLPIVPSVLLVLVTATVIWLASYIYVLYRKVVEDDAQPA